jgi:hypothetical protein
MQFEEKEEGTNVKDVGAERPDLLSLVLLSFCC